MKIRKREICTLLICIVSAVFFITVNSKNSFLYSFNNNADIHCFLTTSRCMLRGDILYRDVYEHRGTVNYYIYCIALLISKHSFTGMYIVEIVFFTVYLYFASKIAELFSERKVISVLTMVFSGLLAASLPFFSGGGESEEFTLPFLIIPLYIIIGHFNKHPDEKLSFSATAVTGVCFAVIFWIKYTLTGMFIGAVVGIVVVCVRRHKYKDIFIYSGQFLLGFLIGSLPVIAYHAVTHSFYDMVYVYFYTLIFKYGRTSPDNTSLAERIFSLLKIVILPLLIIAFSSNKKYNGSVKLLSLLMLSGEAAGISCGFKWAYSDEPLFAFAPICIISLFSIIEEKLVFNENLPEKIKKVIDGFKADYAKDKKKTEIAAYIIFSIAVCISTFSISGSFGYTRFSIEDYPQYRISRYILENGSDDPVIVNYHCLDQGIYWLTEKYPPDKYFCSYNLDSDEINAMYEEYVGGKKADYLVMPVLFKGVYNDPPEGYETVCVEKYPDNDLVGGQLEYQLMKRID